MNDKKFDPQKLLKLNNPQRLLDIPPGLIRNRVRVEAAEVLVEIGAGTAFFSLAFLRQFKGARVYACDLSETMITWIRENVSPDHPEILPVKTEEYAVPLDDGIADLVFTVNLHHELENPLLTLQEALRLLKPGGAIFIVDWKKEEMPEGPPVTIRYEPETVRSQLLETGFGDVDIYTDLPKHFLITGKKPAQ